MEVNETYNSIFQEAKDKVEFEISYQIRTDEMKYFYLDDTAIEKLADYAADMCTPREHRKILTIAANLPWLARITPLDSNSEPPINVVRKNIYNTLKEDLLFYIQENIETWLEKAMAGINPFS